MTYLNLTPHAIHLRAEGMSLDLEPSGTVARVAEVWQPSDSTPHLGYLEYGAPEGLPAPVPGVYLVVSAMVRQALPGRGDLVSPALPIRDDAGRVIGCGAFALNRGAA
jgi:hypothetical protein